jgi:hypothetical protein
MADLPVLAKYTVDEIPPPSKRRRIVLFSKTKRHTRVPEHLVRGFGANGHNVLWIRWSRIRRCLGEWLARRWVRRRLAQFDPQMVLTYKSDVAPGLLASLPQHVPRVVFYEDLFEMARPDLFALAREASLFFTTARGSVPDFRNEGVKNAEYIRTGCDPTDHFIDRPDPAFAGEVAFVGAANMPNRSELLGAVAAECPLALYGRGWEKAIGIRPVREHAYPADLRKICASAKIVLGIDARRDIDLYFSNRTWLTLGCGGFFLTGYVPNLEEYFVNHQHLVWFESVDECLDLIRHYLPKERERRRIARSGCEYVHTYHTFRHATAEMVARAFGEPW